MYRRLRRLVPLQAMGGSTDNYQIVVYSSPDCSMFNLMGRGPDCIGIDSLGVGETFVIIDNLGWPGVLSWLTSLIRANDEFQGSRRILTCHGVTGYIENWVIKYLTDGIRL